MQNLIGANNTINFEEFLTNNVTANTQATAVQIQDFTNIFNSTATQNNNSKYTSNQLNTTNNRKDYTKQADKNKTTDTQRKEINQQKENKVDRNENKTNNKKTDNKTENKNSQTETQNSTQDKDVANENQATITTVQNIELESILNSTNVENSINQALDKINQALETAQDGVIDQQTLEQLTQTLNELQSQIDSNEIVVSEDTQELLTSIIDKLTSQNKSALEVKVLAQDLKQLKEDIQANKFFTQSQNTQEENNTNKALEISLSDNQEVEQKIDTTTSETQTVQKDTQLSALVHKNIANTKEYSETKETSIDIEEIVNQEMLDEMQLKIEDVSTTNDNNANSQQNQNLPTNAQDILMKLSIQNNSEPEAQTNFTFEPKLQAVNGVSGVSGTSAPKGIQLQTATKEINTDDVLNQINSKFEQLKNGSTKITMTLRPQDLGRVTIELSQNANGVSTSIIAQNSQVKELLDKNIDALKQQLAQQGINVQNVQVKTVEGNTQTSFNDNFNGQQEQNRENNQNQNFNNQRQNSEQRQQRQFSFSSPNTSNVIEGADFESQNSQTAQINTGNGTIRYNV